METSLQNSPENNLNVPFDYAHDSNETWENPALHFQVRKKKHKKNVFVDLYKLLKPLILSLIK